MDCEHVVKDGNVCVKCGKPVTECLTEAMEYIDELKAELTEMSGLSDLLPFELEGA
jgi:ferredoxin